MGAPLTPDPKGENSQEAKPEEGAARLALENFPALRTPGRPLYFGAALHPDDKQELEKRGYIPRLLFELSRGSPQAEVDYLMAKAQALEEGTAQGVIRKTDVMLVELQMKANKMLDQRTPNVRVSVNLGKQDVKELLAGWGQSRHTLRGNTTIQEAQKKLGSKEVPARPAPKKKGRK